MPRGGHDHAVGIPQRRGEGLLDQDVRAMASDLFDRGRMLGRGRAQNDQIRAARGHAGPDIGKHPFRRNPEGRDGGAHPRGVLVADTGNLGLGVLVNLPQQIAHMHVVKVHTDNAPSFRCHTSLLPRDRNRQGNSLRPDALYGDLWPEKELRPQKISPKLI